MGQLADVLVVMARYPAPGAVKTRLAERVGPAAAVELYAAFLRDLAARLAAGPWRLVWAVSPPAADLAPFVGAGATQIAQAGPDLAERMRHCFTQLFAGGAPRVVMIGADVPHLPVQAVRDAFAALERDDAVLVPARDGGYVLIGLREPHDVFSGIAMGAATVFAATQRRLETLGLRVRLLPPSFDIDELDDVIELSRLISAGAVDLAHTAAVLNDWRARGLPC